MTRRSGRGIRWQATPTVAGCDLVTSPTAPVGAVTASVTRNTARHVTGDVTGGG